MKFRKLLSLAVAIIMVVGVLAGCNGNGGSSAAENYKDNDETLTLKWLGYPLNPGAEEGTIPELAIEERFNVDIKPMFYEQSNYNDKKTMLMAGGEVPDLIYELDPANLAQDIDQDFVVEVPYETIEEYAPEYYAYITDYVPAAWIYSRYEDANWGIPNANHSHMISNRGIYRKDWLDKLGLEVPKTLDELHDVLYAFANNDPDGNGKKDTYGILGSSQYNKFFGQIFGAYGCLPFDWQEVDGKIVYGGLTDDCKEALKTLAAWYKEGIIHPDFPTASSDIDQFNSGLVGYLVSNSYYNPDLSTELINTVKENNPGAEVAYGFLPTGPDGESGMRAWGRAAHIVAFGNTEGYGAKVPRMLKILEGMFTDKEFYTTLKLGKKGEQWKDAPANTKSQYSFEMLPGYESADEQRLKGLDVNLAGPGMFTPIATDYDTYFSIRSDAWKAWANEWTDEKYSLTDTFFKVDVVPSAAEYLMDLRIKQQAIMCEIIMGQKSIDAYAEFEKLWENNGGATMTEEANELKAELDGIYKEIGVKVK